MSMNSSYGFQNLLKEGHKHYSGLEEALLRNIEAAKNIANITKTSLGPNGMKKMVINHLEKISVTSDAASIVKELEVQHPAAKMLCMASKMQEDECGDMTNFTLAFGGELLNQAEGLIKMGLHPSQIVSGYESAMKAALDLIEQQVVYEVDDPRNFEQMKTAIKSSLSSKFTGYDEYFAELVTKSCIYALPTRAVNFNNENVRVQKILGGQITDSSIIQGLIVNRGSEGTIDRVENPKVVAYGCTLDQQAETKGTVLLKNATELLNYTKSEEELAEKIVKSIAESGCKLIVAGGSVSEIVLHYIEKYSLMVVKVTSKFELKRICKALGCIPKTQFDRPLEDECGVCQSAYVTEIGSNKVTVLKREEEDCKFATIVLRGSTMNFLDDVERAIEDGVSTFKNVLASAKFVYGAGAIEAIMSSKLQIEAKKLDDLSQYSFNRYAQSFDIIPKILCDNAGLNANFVIPQLNTKIEKEPHGISVKTGKIESSASLKVYDHMRTKWWAIRLATDAAITILRVDQIIIAKPAGGPKMPQQPGMDDD